MNLLRRLAVVFLSFFWSVAIASARDAKAATLTTIYTFAHGTLPMTGLVSGPGGALYGATNSTIYELTQDTLGAWHEATIFGVGAAGIVGSATALYAATNTHNTVFELTPPTKGSTLWKSTILHIFRGGKDRSDPLGLAVASDGSVIGTTQLGGGSSACGSENGVPTGCGTLFWLIDAKGKLSEELLHVFQGGSDGAIPVAAPSVDSVGNVYVTTSEGGGSANASAVPSGALPPYRSPRDATDGCGEVGQYDSFELSKIFVPMFVCFNPHEPNPKPPPLRYPESPPYLPVLLPPPPEINGAIPSAAKARVRGDLLPRRAEATKASFFSRYVIRRLRRHCAAHPSGDPLRPKEGPFLHVSRLLTDMVEDVSP